MILIACENHMSGFIKGLRVLVFFKHWTRENHTSRFSGISLTCENHMSGNPNGYSISQQK